MTDQQIFIAIGRLTEQEIRTLALYNSERARGIQHTEEWQEKMAVLQARFKAHG